MAKTKAARPGSFLNSVLNQSVIDQDSKDTGFKASLLEEIEEKEKPAASEQEEKKTQKKRPAVKKPKEEAVTKEDAPAPEKKTVKKEVKKAGRPALSYNPAVTFNVNGTEYEVENPGQVKRDKLVAYVPEELPLDHLFLQSRKASFQFGRRRFFRNGTQPLPDFLLLLQYGGADHGFCIILHDALLPAAPSVFAEPAS